MRVAFVTSRDLPLLTADDQRAARALVARGIAVAPAIWDDPGVAWSRYDALVLRSTWDYHDHLDRFSRWLLGVEQQSIAIWNPPGAVMWNAEKTYLRSLVGGPIAIPGTEFVGRGSGVSLAAVLRTRGWHEVVIKPTVSADGHGVHRVDRENVAAAQGWLDDILQTSGAMIQEFIPAVEDSGETSLIFFDHVFSHAVKRIPGSRDYRVQERLGGRIEPCQPSAELIARCAELMALTRFDLLYARVDVVETPSGPLLMELEMIEPSLYFASIASAVDRFADAVVRRLGSRETRHP